MIHAFICTRSGEKSRDLTNLVSYLESGSINVELLVGKKSIFSAYDNAVKNLTNPSDIVIFCHDDIEILASINSFKNSIYDALSLGQKTGFVGLAGTKCMTPNGIWWDRDTWEAGLHSGCVFHGESRFSMTPTFYGHPTSVVALDGLFLAATVQTLQNLDLSKPKEFTGDWDFYDIYYTIQAYEKGYINRVLPIIARHTSFGNLAGRDSWHENRKAFTKMFRLPIRCL